MPNSVRLVKVDAYAEKKLLDEVQRTLFPQEGAFGDGVWLDPNVTSYWIMADEKSVGIVVTQDDATVGEHYDSEPPPAGGTLYLLLIGCNVEERRKGFALQTLTALKETARTRGFLRMVSNLRLTNVVSLYLHLKAGFQPEGVKPGYYPSPHSEDALILALKL